MSTNQRTYLILGVTVESKIMTELFGEDREELEDIRIGYYTKVDAADPEVKYISGGMGDTEYLGMIIATHTEEDPGFDFLDLSELIEDTKGEVARIRQDLEDDFGLEAEPGLLLFTVYS